MRGAQVHTTGELEGADAGAPVAQSGCAEVLGRIPEGAVVYVNIHAAVVAPPTGAGEVLRTCTVKHRSFALCQLTKWVCDQAACVSNGRVHGTARYAVA